MANSCVTIGDRICPVGGSTNPCEPFQLTKTSDNCLIDNLVAESLLIGGANLNVYKLLGVQGRINPQNLTGFGKAISSPAISGFPAEQVFLETGSFRSQARGATVLQVAYIGFDFGEIMTPRGTAKYGPETFTNRTVSAVTVVQSHCEQNTASKLRVERSPDGVKWYGVDIITLAAGTITYTIRDSVASRFWRVRPLTFEGGSQDFWEVTSLRFHDSAEPRLDNIQDPVLFENRDREYGPVPITLKGKFDHQDSLLELMAHGMQLQQQLVMEISFSQCVQLLGRPMVIGDIIEMPSEVMYDPLLRPIKKFVEVTDVAWSTTGYTPGWVPTLLRVVTQPAIASRETKDIFGSLSSSKIDPANLFDVDDGLNTPKNYQDYSEITQNIRAEAHTQKPMDGTDLSEVGTPTIEDAAAVIAETDPATMPRFYKPQKGAYIEDALPPNDEPFTEGPTLPPVVGATDGQYHRLVYSGAAADIPDRLYKYNAVKGRWIHVETDKRAVHRHVTSRTHQLIEQSKLGPSNQ
jgi:hypothetical protein